MRNRTLEVHTDATHLGRAEPCRPVQHAGRPQAGDAFANPRVRAAIWMAIALAGGLSGSACDREATAGSPEPAHAASAAMASAESLALAEWSGDHAVDERIRKQQERVRTSTTRAEDLDRLGWLFVARARELDDPGSYNMALQCALAIEEVAPGSASALLLRGHALHSLHHFAEAEPIARRLVDARGLPFDLGLLGDVLVDRGKLEEAIDAYQRMMDSRPDSNAYARGAHVRYLKGDLNGAISAMERACRAASPRNRENFAWTWSKLALYRLQAGELDVALSNAQRALQVHPESVPALKAAAQVYLARSEPELALAALDKALERSAHPDLHWMKAETLTALGRAQQASAQEQQLLERGAGEDPRAFALYLASRGRDLPLAARLMEQELRERQDIYSYEALAWVQSAQGRHAEALQSAQRSLAAGTLDPRLYYHAGIVAERAGDTGLAQSRLAQARLGATMLLPSQRNELSARTASARLQ